MAESVPEKGAEAVATEVDLKADEATMEATRSFKAIVLGATGATGRYLVGELLASKDFKEITLLGRRKFTEMPEVFKMDIEKEEASGHLKQITIDLEEANEDNSIKHFEGMDAYFTCFGTTKANAGSCDNFRRIDHGYNVKFAEIAKKAGVGFCSLLSSSGAHPRSYFNYLKVKGEIEDAFTKLEFPFLTIFRPGLLDRKQHQRFQEKLAGLFMTKMPVDALAKAIVADALNQLKRDKAEDRRSHVLSNHQILDLVKAYKKSQEPTPDAAAEKTEADAETSEGVQTEEGKAEQPEEVGSSEDKAAEELPNASEKEAPDAATLKEDSKGDEGAKDSIEAATQ